MMRSLSSAVAGLRSHQTKMDVIGNNIANVNTYGFKASRTTFADVYYQNLASSSKPTADISGGKNPTQIGYGAAIATIDILNTQSGSASTDRAMDVYITGDGFITTQDSSGNKQYSRLGILGFDAAGQIIDSSGNLVLGIQSKDGKLDINKDGTVDPGKIAPIKVDPALLDKLTGISISPAGEIVGILPGKGKIILGNAPTGYITDGSIKLSEDSNLKGAISMKVSAVPNVTNMDALIVPVTGSSSITKVEMGDVSVPAGKWEFSMTAAGEITATLTATGTDTFAAKTYTGTYKPDGTFDLKDSNGKVALTMTTSAGTMPAKINQDPNNTTSPTSPTSTTTAAANVMYTLTGSTAAGSETTVPALLTSAKVKTPDFAGFTMEVEGANIIAALASGENISFTAATAGTEDGEKLVIGNLALARFRNAAGLQQSGQSYFVQTSNSGEATYTKPGIGGTGALKSNYLEMSNVDISKEFTDMITTQRGFQANTRIVTVSDEMLQELVNLKR